MAGPTASVLVPAPLGVRVDSEIWPELIRQADRVEGKDFSVGGRPFTVWFGEEYEGQFEELGSAHVYEVLGWRPQDAIGFAAMCDSDDDHRHLGQLCLRFAQMLDGVVDFGGKILSEPSLDGPTYARPVEVVDPPGLRGRLLAASYVARPGRWRTCHYGDSWFMDAWLRHCDFHMVK